MDYSQYKSRRLLPIVYALHIGLLLWGTATTALNIGRSVLNGSISVPFLGNASEAEPSLYWTVMNISLQVVLLLYGCLICAALCALWTFCYRKIKRYETLPGPNWHGRDIKAVPIMLGLFTVVLLPLSIIGIGTFTVGFLRMCLEDSGVGPLVLVLVGPIVIGASVILFGVTGGLSLGLVPSWFGFCWLMRYILSDARPKDQPAPLP